MVTPVTPVSTSSGLANAHGATGVDQPRAGCFTTREMTLLMAWTDPRCGNWGSDWLLGDLKSCGENRCDSFWLANMATSTLEVSLTNTGTNVKQTYTTIRFTSQKHTQKRRNPNSQNGDAINKKCGFDTHTQTCWSRQDNRKFYLTDYSLEHILYIYIYCIISIYLYVYACA